MLLKKNVLNRGKICFPAHESTTIKYVALTGNLLAIFYTNEIFYVALFLS